MTEPLIGRDELARVIYGVSSHPDDWKYDARTVRTTTLVMHYLREVLTPEAFEHLDDYDQPCMTTDFHHRIFGEPARG